MFTRTLALITLALLFAGCYETTVPLGSPDEAKVDRNLIGEWSFPATSDAKAATLLLRNLDDKRYYAEWTEEGEPTARCVGIVIPIKDAPFAQIRNLPDDGSIAEKHLIVRLNLNDQKLGIRQLNPDFFQGKPASTTEQLRAVISANVDNNDMYAGDYRTATKQSAGNAANN